MSSACLYCGQPFPAEPSVVSTPDDRAADPHADVTSPATGPVEGDGSPVEMPYGASPATAAPAHQEAPAASAPRLTAPPAMRRGKQRQGFVKRAGIGCGAAVLTFVLVILVRLALDVSAGGLGGILPGGAEPTPDASRVYTAALSAHGTSAAGWDNDNRCSARSDGYHIAGSYICYAPIANAGDADISVQVKQVQGDLFEPHGIAFRILGADSHYEFDIDSHGKWVVYKFADGTATALIPYTANAAIARGLDVTNTLDVRAKGSHFDFFVNGAEVGQTDDTTFTSGKTGLVGDDGIEVVFTNFTLVRL